MSGEERRERELLGLGILELAKIIMQREQRIEEISSANTRLTEWGAEMERERNDARDRLRLARALEEAAQDLLVFGDNLDEHGRFIVKRKYFERLDTALVAYREKKEAGQ